MLLEIDGDEVDGEDIGDSCFIGGTEQKEMKITDGW